MPRKSPLTAVLFALALFASACGSDSTTDVSVAADGDNDGGAQSQPAIENGDGTPIPVEPDGGIGDGAEPLPGADEPADTGTWHGAEVAETNCPGTEWKRVEARAFSFSVPADFGESDAQPIDSEIGIWTGGNNLEVLYDYGWYSGSLASIPDAENEPIDYSGVVGELSIVRSGDPMMIGVFFPEVRVVDGQTDRLSLTVNFTDPDDEIIGRCIVGSISWG